MLHRAFKISSSAIFFHREIARIKQLFTDNNYPITVINECIEKITNKRQFNNINSTEVKKEEVLIVYENQMNDQYKKDKKIIKDIISNNVKTTDHDKRLKNIIYYRNCKVKN